MNRIANPYNIHALYTAYNPWEEGVACPLYCGISNLAPTQLKLAAGYSNASGSAYIINPNTGYEEDVSAYLSKACTTAATFFTYDDSALPIDLDEGMYQLKIVIEKPSFPVLYYYGYPYCASTVFDSAVPTLSVACSSSGAGNYTHTYSIAPATSRAGFNYAYEYNIGMGWVHFGTTSGQITQDIWAPSGIFEGYIRLTTYRGNSTSRRVYSFTFDTAAPCSISPVFNYHSGGGTENFMYLEWENSNDIQNYGLYYAGGYKQRFYFEAERAFPVPITEDNYIENGEAGLVFESAVTSEQENVDFYPVPPHAAAILASVRVHDTIDVRSLWSAGNETDIVDFSFTPSLGQGLLCQQGRFSWQRNRQYIGGCQEDYTIQSCP